MPLNKSRCVTRMYIMMEYVKKTYEFFVHPSNFKKRYPVWELLLLALVGSSVWNCSGIPAVEHEFEISTKNDMNH